MTACPADAVLRQLISDGLTGSDLLRVEVHLTTCADCQEPIDDLAGVTEMTSVLGSAAARVPNQSPSLQLIMARLQADSSFWNGGAPAVEIGRVNRSILPESQPTSRGGYIGRLGTIDIRRVIGRGGMGVVFEGLDPILGRTVAVKVLSPHLVRDADAKSRFLREAQAATTGVPSHEDAQRLAGDLNAASASPISDSPRKADSIR